MTICNDILSPGESYEHWCELEPAHSGDHRCGDCGDVWNPADGRGDDEWMTWPEPHERWDGTCAECVGMRGERMSRLENVPSGHENARFFIGYLSATVRATGRATAEDWNQAVRATRLEAGLDPKTSVIGSADR